MNRYLKLLFVGQSLNLLADHLLIPIYALFIVTLGGGLELAGILWGTQALASVVVGLFVMRIKDKPNLDFKLLLLNYFLKASAWTLLIFYQSIAVMFIVQVLIGIASAIGGPSFHALVSEHLDKKRHLKDWGMLQLSTNVVIAAAAISAGFIANISFTFIFIAMVGLELLTLIVLSNLKLVVKKRLP